jgi:hypothetical protein
MKNLIGSISAGILLGTVAVACSPAGDAYLKNQPQTQPAASSNKQASLGSANSQNDLSGDWVCKSGATCSYSLISISKTGSASAVAKIGDSDCEFQHDAKLAVNQDSNQVHVDLSVLSSGSVLDADNCAALAALSSSGGAMKADTPVGQEITQLGFDGSGDDNETYVRKSSSQH